MRKNIVISVYVFLIVLGYAKPVSAQINNRAYSLQSYNVEDGLSEDYIHSLIEDQNGFIWIGTRNGLDRYNGYGFEKIDLPYDMQGQEQVRSLLEDRQGNIWIGTNSGLFCKEFETDRIFKIDLNEQVEVNCLFQDNSGSMWIGASNGILFNYNLTDGKSKSYSIPEKLFITNICQKNDDLIIVFRYYGIAVLNLMSERFFYSKEYNVFDNKTIEAFCKSKAGDLVLSTKSGTFFKEKNKQAQNITRVSTEIDDHSLESVYTITQINDTSIWLGTDGSGILDLNPVSKKVRFIDFNSNIPIKSVTSILQSKNGLIWLGTTNSGLHVFDPNRSLFEHWEYEKGNPTGLGGNSVLSIIELENGDIAMGLDGGGITIYDRMQQRFIHSNAPGIDVNNTLFQSKDDRSLLLGTFENGLKSAKIKDDKQLIAIKKEDPISRNSNIKCIYEDKKGNQWISTHTGIFKRDADGNKQIKKVENNLLRYMFYVIYEDENSVLWLGGEDRLTKYFPDKDSIANIGLEAHQLFQITSITQTEDKSIWVGTKMGLYKINPLNNIQIHYTMENGLPSNSVNSILYDGKESLWLGTDHGLVQMNITNEIFRSFDKEDGLKRVNFNENSALKSKDGRLYFGATNGVCSFYPEEIVKNEQAPNIAFTKFELFNKEVKVDDGSDILNGTLDLTKTINLKHFQNGFSIEFVALNYTNSSKNRYAYQLLGLSDEWIDLDNNRKLTWNNLASGKYILSIKASNNDGVWNETGRKLEIIIAPPWWKTWWALSIFALFFIFIVVLINRYVLRQFRLQDALKIEKIEKENQIKINDLKTQFFMNITHEFKTPLTLIISPLEKVIAGLTRNNSQKKQLVMVYRNAIQLLRLINQLMDFRKVELGKTKLKLEHFDLVHFIHEIIQPFKVLAKEKKITVLFDQKPDELTWWFDHEKLEKIIYNLLSNALKHSPEFGTVEIVLSIESNPKNNLPEKVNICVTDNGQGIPQKEQEAIFERFYRLENDSSTGTGIGLALVKSFTEMHGGILSVDSEINRGSTFKIQLPLLKESNTENKEIEPKYDGDVLQKKLITISDTHMMPNLMNEYSDEEDEKYKILVVEDEKEIREFIVEILSLYFRVKQAANGEEGFEIAKSEFPDLIISDVIMPRINGFELCKKIKTDNDLCHIPVLILTALSSEEEQIKGLKIGADDYISKPFNANTLIYKIKTIIENRRKIINRFKTETAIQPVDIVTHSVDEELIEKTVAVIKENIADSDFKVDSLVSELGMSRSVFFRKIKAITLMSPNELIRAVRLKYSAELLLKSNFNISEITYEVGFVSPKYFRECFKKQFGITPTEYRQNSNKGG
uniref:hybrid sensor histidine kinase/response regulator transcription factor n=1 Tax=uncultured Draconibacterium sp. TaxID=1573823 RepID=UPI0032173A66